MVMIEFVVIIQMRFAASRARRGNVVRPTPNMNIQGGMTDRLIGPRSRPKKRHDEKKGKERKERRERARGPRGRKRRNATGSLSPFSRLVNRRERLWVREDLHSEQMEIFW